MVELFFGILPDDRVKLVFSQTFSSSFSKLDILKMSIFEKLTTTFSRIFY
jgi:hypothetical protein